MSSSFWQPTATIKVLQKRSDFLRAIRNFFFERGVIEVDTPLLSTGIATDPFLHSFALPDQSGKIRYLQTSPEHAMKRLLAAGSGSIFYLGKAFRQGEMGVRHNPEFTMLEWYRPGWDHWQLAEEVAELFQFLLDCDQPKPTTYHDLFARHFKINPHTATSEELKNIALSKKWIDQNHLLDLDKDGWLDLLLTHGIEPSLGKDQPTVVFDFPGSQASLAKTRTVEGENPYEVAERFEFYFKGMELANGYHELSDPAEQLKRFENDLAKRKVLNLPSLPIDHALLAALTSGLPPCAGVAVGVDRLLMLKLKANHIKEVLPFAWEQA
ncbi:MAG: EF-P lysine aminoacylase EpmA [Candidatus Berkiellales bacterium]